VEKYCLGIARNLAKERLRITHREQSAFSEFIDDLGRSCAELVERMYRVLKPCFEQLAPEEQHLLSTYCAELRGRARSEHRRHLARTMGISEQALRLRVNRLRARLTDCARNQLGGLERSLDA